MTKDQGWMSSRAIEIIADDKIRAAQAAGQFDNLPGLGRPHPIFDEEYDPHGWIRRKLAREGLHADSDLSRLQDRR
jgi:hypothetical protein